MILPFPKVLSNIGAPWKPFNVYVSDTFMIICFIFLSLKIAQVWISLAACTVILIVTLKLTNNWNKTGNRYYFGSYQRSSEYVIAVFFSQGNEGSLL